MSEQAIIKRAIAPSTTWCKFGYRSARRKARAGETPALRMVLELMAKTNSHL